MRYIGIIILLVLCLTLLLLTGCIVNTIIPEITSGNLENQENTEEPVEDINQSSNNLQNSSTGSVEEPTEPTEELSEESVIVDTEETETESPQKWSGLGMGTFSGYESYVDIILANGFEELRIDIPSYQNTTWLAVSKASVIRVIAKGAKVIWGVSSNSRNNPDYTITAETWATYRQAILDAAQWAQDNGVFEFQLGNEEELHNDDTTLTDTQLIENLKSVAKDVKKIFTRGNVSYTSCSTSITDWVSAGGKGDIDLLSSNVYMTWGANNPLPWKDEIDTLIDVFGTGGTYITEFGLNWDGLEYYSTDEKVQATAVTEMIDYIKASGITRAFWFMWKDDGVDAQFGAMKFDGTYRKLWDQALLNSGSVKSITVPAKTTTISLPNTIALIPKITK